MNLSVSLPLDSSPGRRAPWQRGFVFDETDLRFAGKRHGMPKPLTLGEVSAEQTERARMLPKSQTHSDTHPACQSHRIAMPLE